MQIATRKPADAAPARMGPLAKLPVFLDLKGKRAVVAGGGAMAVWKAELVAAAGANVEVYAADASAEMLQLVERGVVSGTITLVPRAWEAGDLAGAVMALLEASTEEEAQAFWEAGRAAGAIVNVIDKPAYCQLQFGAIVNRSPVVIGISTDGAAPILGQAIRRRIETLLPPSLAIWGAFAKSVRRAILDRVPGRHERRAVWERMAERAFGPAPANSNDETLDELLAVASHGVGAGRGRVTLVGAGPGDAELLTLKAVRALQAADVILFDDLVSDDVLELARREAHRMLVGKRGRRESCRQEDINALMIKLAGQGKHVVRLKSGDPMVFGRAGEEIEQLAAAGIAVEVVPGITSANAMAAALGVSLTHRDHAHSVRFLTGHARDGELPADIDWKGLADPATTLVVYMGGRTAPAIARKLMENGLAPSTPVVAVAGVARGEERRLTTTLRELPAADLTAWASRSPVLLGIGAVFAQVVSEMACETSELQLRA